MNWREEIDEHFAMMSGCVAYEDYSGMSVVDRRWFSSGDPSDVEGQGRRSDLIDGGVQLDVLARLKSEGKNNKQISREMGITRTRVIRALRKLSVSLPCGEVLENQIAAE